MAFWGGKKVRKSKKIYFYSPKVKVYLESLIEIHLVKNRYHLFFGGTESEFN